MTNLFVKRFIVFIFFFLSLTGTKQNYGEELLIFADDISYDKDENIIAKGKAKVINGNKIITSELIIYSKTKEEITLPLEFNFKDEKNNYYYGSNGFFKKDLDYGSINDVKILLEDGSRIVGKKAKRIKNIDLITKAVYSPCNSRIKISNFLCPIWQLEGEKMLHDYDTLFLYQKHTKMRVLNLPVFYSPYLVTPSPLRKERKSGFLTPSVNLFFFDTKISQSTSFPYYFNISQDKELTFTPTINYGGGVDSSQRFNFDYNQIVSGGFLKTNLTVDSTFENQNSDKWLKEGSIVNNLNTNINEKFNLNISSALQTSKDYIQQVSPNDDLSYASSLTSSMEINGYNLNKIDDRLMINISTYQINQNNEDNKTIPTILPYLTYNTGNYELKKQIKYNNNYEFYNIFRDTPTDIHSKSQRKISSTISLNKEAINYGSKINFRANIYNQLFDTENKKINGNFQSNTYFRSFPILGLDLSTPFRFKTDKNNLIYTPKISFVVSPGLSNSEKISNEDSSVNSYTIDNNNSLNRFTGTDKLDNSKRLNLSFNINNESLSAAFLQSYEFTDNSNFHYSQGNEKKLSDFLGIFSVTKNSLKTNYDFRYDSNESYLKSQKLTLGYNSYLGNFNFNYLDQNSKVDEIIVSDLETLNYEFKSKKINKFSEITYFGLYDLKNEINTESGISYSYFDECFGVNIDFKRNSYTEDKLKPQDILTVMFSFKNVGSYKSTNLAVSENDKQDIEWENISLNNDLFN